MIGALVASVGIEGRIKAQAYGLGFDLVGITSLDSVQTAPAFEAWLAQGFSGHMEYLPRGASLTAWQVESPRRGPLVEWGGARVDVLEDRGVFTRLRVSSETEVTLRWARWAFPQWRLDVNGSSAALERGPSGEIASRIPAGSHELELRYEPPAARRAGLWLSGIALLSCAAIALSGARRGRSAQPGPFARATQR